MSQAPPYSSARAVAAPTLAVKGTRSAAAPSAPTLPHSLKQQKLEAKHKSMKERETFLLALLQEEMEGLESAQRERTALEQCVGTLGRNHVQELLKQPELAEKIAAAAAQANPSTMSNADFSRLTKEQQYLLALEELRYVASRPVGSKRNIIRLYYLLEEVKRANNGSILQ